jgi:type I restriction enzyme, R subunit
MQRLDGATVPILYEVRTADGFVKNASGLDDLFVDMFRDYTPDELAVIKAKYATEGDVLEAPLLIEQKARDMIRHYVEVVLPEGYKAQVVATSRAAAVTYHTKLMAARDELLTQLESLSPATLALSEEEIEKLDSFTRFYVRAHPSCRSSAHWSSRSSFPATTMIRSRGEIGPTRTSKRII